MLANTPFVNGRDGLPVMKLNTAAGASMDIYRHGAHLTSWKTAAGKEWMFLSRQAVFAENSAIRGGVPVIFPQFSGFGSGRRHGFARNTEWQLTQTAHTTDSAQCTFSLESNDATLALWPHRFHAEFTAALQNQHLSMTLTIRNTDTKPFTFSAALHTYFAVGDLHKVQLSGLKGIKYWDNNGSDFIRDRFVETQDTLTFADAIDRVYFDCNTPLELRDQHNRLDIQMQGFKEAVVWNPGKEASKQLNDMADDEYRLMLCVEAAVIDHPITLSPGEAWSGSQRLTSSQV